MSERKEFRAEDTAWYRQLQEAKTTREKRDALAIRIFEVMLAAGQVDTREPKRAARCAVHAADVLIEELQAKVTNQGASHEA